MNIGFYGDSTQVGVSLYSNVVYSNDYPPSKVVQMMLDDKYGEGVHTVNNYGIGGSTLIQAMDTPLFAGKNVVQHMQSQNDDLVVANWGINDAYVAGNTPTAHKTYYNTLKQSIEGLNKTFLYESPNPMNNTHDTILTSFISSVKEISNIVVTDVNGQTKSYYPQWAYHLSDGIHPNQIMYLWIGLVLFKKIDMLV